MRIISFKEQERLTAKHPDLVKKVQALPSCDNAITFDQFHERITMRAEVVCEVIGCRGLEDMIAQDAELQSKRKELFENAEAYWNAFHAEHHTAEASPSLKLLEQFRAQQEVWYHAEKKCHRAWTIAQPGVRCYCDQVRKWIRNLERW